MQSLGTRSKIVETLSGGQAAVGKMFLTAINYGLIKVNDEKAWPDGVKVLEYDNQGGPSEAADKVKADLVHYKRRGISDRRIAALVGAGEE